jgi:hypothetical protein
LIELGGSKEVRGGLAISANKQGVDFMLGLWDWGR